MRAHQFCFRVLVEMFLKVPVPLSVEDSIARVSRSMADAFAALGDVPPASYEEWKIEVDSLRYDDSDG